MATRNIVVIKHHHQPEHQPAKHHRPQDKHLSPLSIAALAASPPPRHHHHHHHYHQQQQQQQHQEHQRHHRTIVATTKWQWHHVPSFGITATAATATFWVCVAVCLLNPALPEVIYRVDPLALLAATLRTYQRAGCDSEQLSLSCPRGTSISIELAQYGRAGDLSDHSLCPPASQEDLTTTGSAASASSNSIASGNSNNNNDGVIHSGTEIEVKPPESCTVSGLQYALLQTVVDACQKKRHCKFAANPKSLSAGGDPCSGIRKFVEIAYKCRPYEFRSKVACENDNMPLVCNPYSRIAIYSASFGHTERESIQCGHGNTPDNPEDTGKQTCLVSYATETVMQICHGRRRCSITADAGTFGRPCKNDVRMYLKVVYTCIPRKVLKDRYETAPEVDEPQQSELDMDQDDLYDEDQFYKESEAIPPAPKLQGAIPNPAFPFDFNLADDFQQSSTGMPPLLSSRNDGTTLEDRQLQSSPSSANAWWWFRKQKQKQKQRTQTTPASSAASSFNGQYAGTSNNYDDVTLETPATGIATESAIAIAVDETITTTESATDYNDNDVARAAASDVITSQNFFYRRKCQMEDDWGPIGLDCNDEDIVTERVEVVGFLVNWMQAYVHIRKNQEQFYLYLIISVAAGVLLCLTLVVGRLTLQRRRSTCRKNSSSSGSNNGKNCNDTGGGGSGGEKFHHQQSATGETQLPNSFGDDISDIDADIDLTSPMPVPSLSSRNETYMTYAPTQNCAAYGSGGLPPHSSATTTTLLMPATHHGGLLMSSGQQQQQHHHQQQQHGNIKQMSSGMGLGCGGVGVNVGGPASNINIGGRQSSTPPPGTLYTSMGVCSPTVSGTMTMVPHMLAPSALGAVSHHSGGIGPSYLSSAMMVPGHHHAHIGGTLRRTLIPTSMGMMMGGGGTASPPPSLTQQTNSGMGGGGMPHSMAGIPSASSIYYDSTIPRNLNRGMSADSAAAAQYFYG